MERSDSHHPRFDKLIDYLARVPAIETNSTRSRGLGSGSLPQLRVHQLR
jgi:hypothetical protein